MSIAAEYISSLKNARVLVTGGGGFLGKAIIRRLLTHTPDIRSLGRNLYPDLDAFGIEQIQGDISDPAAVERACQDRSLVFHVAAKTGIWGRYRDFYDTNVTGTRHVVKSCQRHNISYLIYTSSASVVHHANTDIMGVDETTPYPERYQTYYQETKAMAERVVIQAADSSLNTIVLRPHLIWGPGDTQFAPRIIQRANVLRRVGDGKNRVDTTFIDNAVQAHFLAAERLLENRHLSGNIYFISQGEPVYLWDMVDHILMSAGRKPVRKTIPKSLAYAVGTIMEVVYKSMRIRSEPRMTRFLANELASHHWFDIGAARKDLGYVPEVSMADGLEQLKDWMKTWN
jgi:nucleoside-diphosphate-sugar epimerase